MERLNPKRASQAIRSLQEQGDAFAMDQQSRTH
jgi:hypothetical protein